MTDQERAERLAAIQARRGAAKQQPAAKSQPAAASQPATPLVGQGSKPTRKPHAAGGARWVVAGVSAAATVGMIGAMTASAMTAQAAAGPDVVTVVVSEAPAATTIAAGPGEVAMAAPTAATATANNDAMAQTLADTAQAEPSYQVVAKEKPATAKSSGS